MNPVFKTFAATEGLTEWALSAFSLLMVVFHANGLEPTKPAQIAAHKILSASCATFTVIYRENARVYHPDKNKDSDTTADMMLINDAYDKRKARGGCPSTKASKAQGKAQGKAKGKAQGKAKGKAQGKAKGKAQGKAKGKAKGKAQGKAQGKAKGKSQGKKGKAKARRTKADKNEGVFIRQLVAGLGAGCAVGYTAKECREASGRRRSRSSSPGRQTR